jgi:hypothetical protein
MPNKSHELLQLLKTEASLAMEIPVPKRDFAVAAIKL